MKVTLTENRDKSTPFGKLALGDLFLLGDEVYLVTTWSGSGHCAARIETGKLRDVHAAAVTIPLKGELTVWPKE